MVKVDILEFITIPVNDEDLLRDPSIIKLCRYPYKTSGKYRGCPNSLGPGKSCKEAYIDDIAGPPWLLNCAVGDFKKYLGDMKELHPTWTDKQLRNPLYWQGNMRKQLREYTEEVMEIENIDGGFFYMTIPEAYGVNIIATLEILGYNIEHIPTDLIWRVHLIARRRGG